MAEDFFARAVIPPTVRRVSWEWVSRFRGMTEPEVVLKDTKKTIWIATPGGESFGGLIHVSAGKYRCKCGFTLPESRNQGLNSLIVDARINIARSMGAVEVEAISRHPSIFLRRGFELVKMSPNGVQVVRLRL